MTPEGPTEPTIGNDGSYTVHHNPWATDCSGYYTLSHPSENQHITISSHRRRIRYPWGCPCVTAVALTGLLITNAVGSGPIQFFKGALLGSAIVTAVWTIGWVIARIMNRTHR